MYIYIYIYLVYSIYMYTYNSYLASLDVKSLYTNIPNSEGIKAVKTLLDKFPRKTIATKVIKGCAMGTICAPS